MSIMNVQRAANNFTEGVHVYVQAKGKKVKSIHEQYESRFVDTVRVGLSSEY